MTTIGVTGADGFFGWHLRCRLVSLGIAFVAANRTTFESDERLDSFIRNSDAIVHLAGVNRASDAEVHAGNLAAADALVAGLQRTAAAPLLIFANSVKAGEGSAYGQSKAEAATRFAAWAKGCGATFVDVACPHLFGEFGRPHYNSAVSTFAHQLARGEPSSIGDGHLELLHVQQACQSIIDLATGVVRATSVRLTGCEITVADCHARMDRLADYVVAGVVPHIEDAVDLGLLNTIRSQMWPDAWPMNLTRHADARGAFFEVVRAWGQGQTSISTTVPGVTRGDHYHLDKIERFAVVSGQARIRVRRLFDDHMTVFDVTGQEPVFVDMPTLCTHNITNTGSSELVTLFWSHDHFDPTTADTYALAVEGEGLPA